MDRYLTLFTTDPPFGLAWEAGDAETAAIKARRCITNPSLAAGNRFVCAQCGGDVTHASQRIAVGGSHRHTVPSAYGLDQEIGCFSLAPGCTVLGRFALDFSRPSEGQWQMGICASCGNHLGWHHRGADGIGFFGLILDHLAVAPDDESEETD